MPDVAEFKHTDMANYHTEVITQIQYFVIFHLLCFPNYPIFCKIHRSLTVVTYVFYLLSMARHFWLALPTFAKHVRVFIDLSLLPLLVQNQLHYLYFPVLKMCGRRLCRNFFMWKVFKRLHLTFGMKTVLFGFILFPTPCSAYLWYRSCRGRKKKHIFS